MAKMSSPPRTESESTNWRELYKAAILELDLSKLSQRISEAETALIQRQLEFFQETGGNIEEEQALDNAMYFLHALRSTLKFSTSASHQVGNDDSMKAAWTDQDCIVKKFKKSVRRMPPTARNVGPRLPPLIYRHEHHSKTSEYYIQLADKLLRTWLERVSHWIEVPLRPIPKRFSEVIEKLPPNSWVALTTDRKLVVGLGVTQQEAAKNAEAHYGFDNPILIQVPDPVVKGK